MLCVLPSNKRRKINHVFATPYREKKRKHLESSHVSPLKKRKREKPPESLPKKRKREKQMEVEEVPKAKRPRQHVRCILHESPYICDMYECTGTQKIYPKHSMPYIN